MCRIKIIHQHCRVLRSFLSDTEVSFICHRHTTEKSGVVSGIAARSCLQIGPLCCKHAHFLLSTTVAIIARSTADSAHAFMRSSDALPHVVCMTCKHQNQYTQVYMHPEQKASIRANMQDLLSSSQALPPLLTLGHPQYMKPSRLPGCSWEHGYNAMHALPASVGLSAGTASVWHLLA